MLGTIVHNILGQHGTEASHIGEQLARGGVHVHTHLVHATLHREVECVAQHRLVHIVLILPHAYALGVDFH